MKYQAKRHLLCALLVAALGAPAGVAMSQTVSATVEQEATSFDRTASKAPTRAATDMAKTFSSLTGSEATTLTLIEGLRDGTVVTLDPGTPTTPPVTVTPTAAMGYGNVFITLALAQENLKQAGVTAPAATDLAAALNGGTIEVNGQLTTFRGILAMRAAGMGWGQIAKEGGFNLGRVVSALKSGNEHLAKAPKEGGVAGSKVTGQERAAEKAADKAIEKADKQAGFDKSEPVERMSKIERPEKVERAQRPERPERPEKVERPEKIERPGKS